MTFNAWQMTGNENMNYKQTGDNTWVVTVMENGKTKELYIEFPPDALNQVGWDEGDTLIWEELPNGNWQISKKEQKPKVVYPVDKEITKGTRMDDNYYFFKKEVDDARSDDD